jgi:hypothetical protein
MIAVGESRHPFPLLESAKRFYSTPRSLPLSSGSVDDAPKCIELWKATDSTHLCQGWSRNTSDVARRQSIDAAGAFFLRNGGSDIESVDRLIT